MSVIRFVDPPAKTLNGKIFACNGSALVLAFPPRIIGEITNYLTPMDILEMYYTGSSRLRAMLESTEGVLVWRANRQSGRLFAQCMKALSLGKPLFGHLTTFDFTPMNGDDRFKINQLPPTITDLRIDAHRAIHMFITLSEEEVRSKWKTNPSDPRLTPLWYNPHTTPTPSVIWLMAEALASDDPTLWLNVKAIMPRLRRFRRGLYSWSVDTTNLTHWFQTLPATIEHGFVEANDESALDARLALLPPNWTSIDIHRQSRFLSFDRMQLLSPPHLQSLSIPQSIIPIESLSLFQRLTRLRVGCISDHPLSFKLAPTQSVIPLLPPQLEYLAVENMMQTRTPTSPALVKSFPRSLTFLKWPHIPSLGFPHLPPNLLHLFATETGYSDDSIGPSELSELPKSLIEISLPTINWSFSLLLALPPRLTSLHVQKGELQDDWIPKLPRSITHIDCRRWKLTGWHLPVHISHVGTRELRNSYFNIPIRVPPGSSCTQLITDELLYCPPNVKNIDSLKYDQICVRELPRALETITSHYKGILDNGRDVYDLPQGLRRLSLDGTFSLAFWLLLPASLTRVSGHSTVSLDDSDICKALHLLKDMERDKKPANAGGLLGPSYDCSSFHMPETIASALRLSLKDLPISQQLPPPSHWQAEWSTRHYQLLPDSVTSLHIRGPKTKPNAKASLDTDAACEAAKRLSLISVLPDSITSMIIECDFADTQLLGPMLPSSLTSMTIYGAVCVQDLKHIHTWKALKSLTIRKLNDRDGLSPSLEAFFSSLPLSLEHLDLRFPIQPQFFLFLPRSLTSLHLRHPQTYHASQFDSLPPNLTSLTLESTNTPPDYVHHLPKGLKALSLGTGICIRAWQALHATC
jgi:hypothetical protein